jgi:carbonic anhydrase
MPAAKNIACGMHRGDLEYGVNVVGATLIVVLGHTECGAVKGACDNVQLGHLPATLARIRLAADAVPDDGSPRNSKNAAFVQKVADKNVSLAVKQIREQSPLLRESLEAGRLNGSPGRIGGWSWAI